MEEIGKRITLYMDSLKGKELIIKQRTKDEIAIIDISKNNYKVEIIINPHNWLGLEFDLFATNNQVQFSHAINTDLYPISKPKYYEFAKEIEDEILNFLDALINHRIIVGTINNKTTIIIPKGNKYFLISKGRFLSTGSYYKKIEDINNFKEIAKI